MSYTCEYCNSNFTRSYSLKHHQMKAKYCVALQEQRILQEQRTLQERHAQKYVCESCGIELTRKDNLKRHQEVCKRHQEVKKEELERKRANRLRFLN